MPTERLSNQAFIRNALADRSIVIDDSTRHLMQLSVDTDDLSAFADCTLEQLQNAFFAVLFNKVTRQLFFDLTADWANDLSQIFLKDSRTFGEYTEVATMDVDPETDVFDYTMTDLEKNNPFKYFAKPKMANDLYGIKQDKVWYTTIQNEQMRRAMITDGGIYDTIVSQIIGALNKKADMYLYNYALDMLTDIPLSYAITAPKMGDSEANEKAYTEINILKDKMRLLNHREFNERNFQSTTRPQNATLVLRTEENSYFDMSILAKLFNSSAVDLKGRIGNIIPLDFGEKEDKDTFGYYFDNRKMRQEIYYEYTQAFPILRGVNYFHSLVLKSGMISTINGVKLKTSLDAPTANLDKVKHILTAKNTTVNGTLYYKKDSGAETAYTGPINVSSATGTYHFYTKKEGFADSQVTDIVVA